MRVELGDHGCPWNHQRLIQIDGGSLSCAGTFKEELSGCEVHINPAALLVAPGCVLRLRGHHRKGASLRATAKMVCIAPPHTQTDPARQRHRA
jgi:hypothetical protein